jgi:hypothetical protein
LLLPVSTAVSHDGHGTEAPGAQIGVAVSEYVVVCAGVTVTVPLPDPLVSARAGSATPSDPPSVAVAAFVTDHVSVTLWPLVIDAALAVSVAVGITGSTVRMAVCVAGVVLVGPVAVRV